MARNGWIRTAGGDLVPGYDNRTPEGTYMQDTPGLWEAHNTPDPFTLWPAGEPFGPADVAAWTKVADNRFNVRLHNGREGWVTNPNFAKMM